MPATLPFDNSYAALPERFFARVDPAEFPAPRLIRLNRELAQALQLDPEWLSGDEGVAFLSGQTIAHGSQPIATAYAGHQFGNFVPQLGDGRAILLGELLDCDGRRFDIQLKGSGRTPFSRMGDGRAAIGPVLREYIVSEFMAAVGIPTTRSLAALTTGEPVYRERALPGAALVRVASSHIRVGTFQYFAARGDAEALQALADHVIARHYPEAAQTDSPYRALLDRVVAAQADLIAQWLLIGFIHGVMNTDNASIAGETIDYGPCAFMDEYDPATVFSSIDQMGRYAYGNQPQIGLWNLTRFAETLLPLLGGEEQAIAIAQEALSAYEPRFVEAHRDGMRRKLGLGTPHEADAELANAVLTAMAENQVDFTLFFRRLSGVIEPEADEEPVRSLFVDPTAADALLRSWRARLALEPDESAERQAAMDRVNPAFIPRNHRIEEVIKAATEDDDFGPFEELIAVLAHPFDEQPGMARYAQPPLEHERVRATFCGT